MFYVLGFSIVFIVPGILFGIGGAALARYQDVLIKIGGVFILFFGFVSCLLDRDRIAIGIWLSWTYRLFEVFQYDRLLDYL